MTLPEIIYPTADSTLDMKNQYFGDINDFRNLREAESTNIVPSALFFAKLLTDNRDERQGYFSEWNTSAGRVWSLKKPVVQKSEFLEDFLLSPQHPLTSPQQSFINQI